MGSRNCAVVGTVFGLVTLFFGTSARGQEPKPSDEKPAASAPDAKPAESAAEPELTDPHEILRRAHEAIRKYDFFSYKGVFAGTGFMVNTSPWVEGTAILQGKTTKGYKHYRFELKARMPNEAIAEEFTIGTDGSAYYLIDNSSKTVHSNVSEAVMGERRATLGKAIAMQQFVHPAPYADEMRAVSVRLRGITKVKGEDCYELYVKSDDIPGATLWCFAKSDFLPRRLDRIVIHPTGEQGSMQWVLSDVTPNPKFDRDPFRLQVPDGYTLTSEPAP